jgi:hypothetical protein
MTQGSYCAFGIRAPPHLPLMPVWQQLRPVAQSLFDEQLSFRACFFGGVVVVVVVVAVAVTVAVAVAINVAVAVGVAVASGALEVVGAIVTVEVD